MGGDPVKEEEQDTSLDSVHVEVLLRAVRKAGEKSATTVRIFEKNDFYYVFEKDAEFGAKLIYGSSTVTKVMGKTSPVTYCSMNHANFESLLRHALLVNHYRVEVWKFIAPRAGNAARYDLEVRASPGNVSAVEHILYSEGEERRETNFLLAVKLGTVAGQVELGLAAIDTSLNCAQVTDILDNEWLAGLEAVLVTVAPREVLLPQSEHAMVRRIKEVVERNRVLATPRPTKDFAPLSEAEVARLLAPKVSPGPVRAAPLSSGCLRACTEYLGLREEPRLHLEALAQGGGMRLDPRAVQGLNLLPDPAHPALPSILSILNKTRTPGGARLITSWIKAPLVEVDKITERLDLVEVMVTSTEVRQALYEEHLRRLPDFQRLAAKFSAGRGGLQDAYRVFVALERLEPMVACLQAYQGDSLPQLQDNFIKDLQEAQRDLDNFHKMVETTVDLEEVKKGNFLIKPSFDDNLAELRAELDELEAKLGQARDRAAAELGQESVKLEESSHQGFFFRLTLKEGGGVSRNKNFTVMETNKTGVRFRNSLLSRLNEQQLETRRRYEEQQKSVVVEVMEVAAGYTQPLLHLGRCVSRLDCIVGLAVAAVSAPVQYCRPSILAPSDPRALTFSQLRHPIVELQDRVNYIPNDVSLSPSSSLHLITGPNMGGKSTYLRSVGCAVLMAQVGAFVPADSAELSVVDSVLVRIGAGDCQAEGRSTFMAEMVETSSILATATAASLVLIDELGRGTSTYDGFGLAWAVSEHLATQLASFTLFTTHYTELTQLAEKVANVSNFHVSAITDQSKLTLLYQLLPGVCDRSFGINVAQIARFPQEVIAEAEARMARLEGFAQGEEVAGAQVREGEAYIAAVLARVAALEGGQVAELEEVLGEVAASTNPFIRGLVTQARATQMEVQ